MIVCSRWYLLTSRLNHYIGCGKVYKQKWGILKFKTQKSIRNSFVLIFDPYTKNKLKNLHRIIKAMLSCPFPIWFLTSQMYVPESSSVMLKRAKFWGLDELWSISPLNIQEKFNWDKLFSLLHVKVMSFPSSMNCVCSGYTFTKGITVTVIKITD